MFALQRPAALPPAGDSDAPRLTDLLFVVLRRAWLVAAVVALFVVPVLVHDSVVSPAYEAQVGLLAVSSAGSDPPAAAAVLPRVKALLENRALASGVIRELGLGIAAEDFVRDAVAVEPVRGTSQLRLRVRLGDPERAARAANLLSQRAAELHRRIATEEVNANRTIIAAQLDVARRRFAAAEEALVGYRKRAHLELVREDAKSVIESRAQLLGLDADIQQERGRLQRLEAELTRHASGQGDGETRFARAQADPDSRAERAGADPNVDPLARHVDGRPTSANQVTAMLDYEASMSRARLDGLVRRRGELAERQRTAARPEADLATLYEAEAEQGRLQVGYDVAKQLYTGLAERYEHASLPVASPTELRIIDEAVQPSRAVRPRRALNAALALLAGLVGGVLVALAAEFLQSRRTAPVARDHAPERP